MALEIKKEKFSILKSMILRKKLNSQICNSAASFKKQEKHSIVHYLK